MRNNNKYKNYTALKLRKNKIVSYKYTFRMKKHEKQSRQ